VIFDFERKAGSSKRNPRKEAYFGKEEHALTMKMRQKGSAR
jgi:hypothetical protein